jgi:hypothetical protein
MKKYITEVSENVFKFDLGNFLSTQGLIYDKFKFEGKRIDVIDKYLFQIIEEIQEVNAIEEDVYAKYGEVVDVLMYLGSTYYVFSGFNSFSNRIIVRKNNKMKIKPLMDDIFSTLINARRMYPERKWHKPYDENKLIQNREQMFSEVIVALIIKIIDLLLTNLDVDSIEDLISEKQSFIYNLDRLEEKVEHDLNGNLAIAYEELKRFMNDHTNDDVNKFSPWNQAYNYMINDVGLPHHQVVEALNEAVKIIEEELKR